MLVWKKCIRINLKYKTCTGGGDVTHHAVGERVAGLGHRQTLDHLRSHPGKCAHQRHVCRVVQEPGCPEITDLKG